MVGIKDLCWHVHLLGRDSSKYCICLLHTQFIARHFYLQESRRSGMRQWSNSYGQRYWEICLPCLRRLLPLYRFTVLISIPKDLHDRDSDRHPSAYLVLLLGII